MGLESLARANWMLLTRLAMSMLCTIFPDWRGRANSLSISVDGLTLFLAGGRSHDFPTETEGRVDLQYLMVQPSLSRHGLARLGLASTYLGQLGSGPGLA